jgi:hypothetical protein
MTPAAEVLRELMSMEERVAQLFGSHTRVMQTEIHQIKEMLMSIQPQVQALLDAVAAQGAAINDATKEIVTLEGQVADLQSKLTAIQSQPTVTGDDIAAIVQATGTISSSIQTIKGVMPQPVADATVAAAAAPAADAAPAAN